MNFEDFSHPAGRPIERPLFLQLVETALFMGQLNFSRQALLAWLAAYPGDLPISLLYAQTLLKAGQVQQALSILVRLTHLDPEWLEATRLRLEAELKLRAMVQSSIEGAHTGHRSDTSAHSVSQPGAKSPSRPPSISEALGCLLALGGAVEDESSLGPHAKDATTALWSQQVRQARLVLEQFAGPGAKSATALDQADMLLSPALATDPSTPLVAVTHLRLLHARATPTNSLRSVAEFYHQRWPNCLQFQLLLAGALMEVSEPDQAVALLHRAATGDVTGQVATRLWGSDHPYRSLWPERQMVPLDILIPGPVAAALGWNQLQDGKPESVPVFSPAKGPEARPFIYAQVDSRPADRNPAFSAKSPNIPIDSQPAPQAESIPTPAAQTDVQPETLVSVQAELERLADRMRQPGLARSDGRFPVYVIMTTRRGLSVQYGQSSEQVEKSLQNLAKAVQGRRDWRSQVFFADEGLPPQVAPARYNDPWALKLALVDLDAALAHRGEMIGALLIVGGPEIVPFHHLPNPVDDADDDVPSDNPYSTRDENYFIPEWPVGRLPAGVSKTPNTLVHALQKLADQHQAQVRNSQPRPWYRRLWQALLGWLSFGKIRKETTPHRNPSFGYTAAIWQRASQLVFRPIGEPRALRVSPPVGLADEANRPLPSARLGYFNLHGLADAVEWYGQSEPIAASSPAGGVELPEYPIAVRPEDIINSGHAPQVVFSEACYGAHILGKSMEEALALKFLQSGSQAVIGSTCTAYGSINTPLTAADFLGQSFWESLRQGVPAGEALRRAKVALAREMHRRQGYLDGEDQKTLISFVLYGDPLAQPLGPGKQSKSILRPIKPPKGIRTVCDRARQQDLVSPVPTEVIENVKHIVEQYLPGMQDADLALSHEHSECGMAGHICPTSQLQNPAAKASSHPPQRSVVVLSKQFASAQHTHQHYARLTLDEQNHLVKLVVSR